MSAPDPPLSIQRARGLIRTPWRASRDPFPQYHEIWTEARMSEPPWPPGSYAEAHAEERARIEAEHKATENEPPGAMLDESWILTAENLDCLGLRRAFKDDFFSDLKKQAEEEYFANLPKPPK